jgi:protein SCO1/2
MKGKVWVANFFFTSCTGTCPKLLSKIQELRSQIADRDVTFVSISNDPGTDTPRVLKQYSQKFGADDRWYFLTGEQQLQIRAIGSEFFGVNGGVGETHSEQLTVVDKQGNIRGHFDYNQAAELTQLRLLLDDLISEKDPT